MSNDQAMGSAPPAKPVWLQLNNSGSWKTLAAFDAADDEQVDKARAAGQLLGDLGGERTTLRIATQDTLPLVLVRWTAERGWFEVPSGRQWER